MPILLPKPPFGRGLTHNHLFSPKDLTCEVPQSAPTLIFFGGGDCYSLPHPELAGKERCAFVSSLLSGACMNFARVPS